MIRLASKDDWPSISDISRRSGYIDYINRIGESYLDDGEVYVYANTEVRAFAKLHYLSDNAVWSSGLRVDPDHWRKGIGTILTKAMVDIAREKKYDSFRVLVFDDNFRSLKLVEKLGGRKVGEYCFFQALPNQDGFTGKKEEVTGYINSSWEFTKYSRNNSAEFEVRELDGWKFISTDENTVQILRRGKGKLTVKNTEGFTCIQDFNNSDIFEGDPERSRGYLLEIPLSKT